MKTSLSALLVDFSPQHLRHGLCLFSNETWPKSQDTTETEREDGARRPRGSSIVANNLLVPGPNTFYHPPFMTPHPQYGSLQDKGDDNGVVPHTQYLNGDITAPFQSSKSWWSHRCISYTLAALLCLFSANYWHTRAIGYSASKDNSFNVDNDNSKNKRVAFPMPQPLSLLDPTSDLGFRQVIRKDDALPSTAWKEWRAKQQSKFTPLPTNQWYLNLLSHRAALDPTNAEEVAHVYTIPYIVGVSPPKAEVLPKSKATTSTAAMETMAGIQLFMPVVKASDNNMQMVFDKNNGMSLGAVVDGGGSISTKYNNNNDHPKKEGDDGGGPPPSLTSYIVDPDESISPLGVSIKWNHVNMKSHIVRGMPYGTIRFGRDAHKKHVLPTILSGNRVISILIDSNDTVGLQNEKEEGSSFDSKKKTIMCGSFTGKPVEQDQNNQKAAISSTGKAESYSVTRELILHMDTSDFTWIVFFSKPVKVQCYSSFFPMVSTPDDTPEGSSFRLNVVEVDDESDNNEDELVVRMALLNECTTGKSVIKEHCDILSTLGYPTVSSKDRSKEYIKVLREGAMLYPKSPEVGTQFPDKDEGVEDSSRVTNIVFDWDVTSVNPKGKSLIGHENVDASVVDGSFGLRATSTDRLGKSKSEDDAFIMFALPHHLEDLHFSSENLGDSLCIHSFHGRTCLVQGSTWNMPVSHGKPHSFIADRPPAAAAIPLIATALSEDIKYTITDNVLRGAADTYFPAKILAKMGRIIEIKDEIQLLKSGGEQSNVYSDADKFVIEDAESAASGVDLPSDGEVEALLDNLQQSIEVWLNPGGKEKGGAEAEFLYDKTWGGFVNCGCKYKFDKGHEDKGNCSNTFPDCPALASVNENFGNGFYNDHHFHYGYHIYAAAIVAKHRPDWAKKYHERILLYIRDIANPSADDKHFPMFRQKDWYLGNSWAGGLLSMELSPHGREQESSSEAIAAFEGIALYGKVMMDVFVGDKEKVGSARLVRNVGELLTAMEVSAANRFWHVWGPTIGSYIGEQNNSTKGESRTTHIDTYPAEYKRPVVGMMYDTMASFQTWFSSEPVVSYGIQLIPLTAVSERRDDPKWSKVVYPVYAESCKSSNEAHDGFCEKNGWSIFEGALLAEIGRIDDALEFALKIPSEVFISQGACGNSLTNTLWFISTRKQ